MKKLYTPSALLLLLLVSLSQSATACYCQPPSLAYFWDVVSPYSHNAMVSFVEIDESLSNQEETVGRFVVLENFNIPDIEVKDTLILKSGTTTCDFPMLFSRPNDTLIVALYDDYRLYGGCIFNYLGIWQGYGEGQTLEEIRVRIMNITSSPGNLFSRVQTIMHPNPASSTLTVTIPYAGRFPCKIEILDMSGRVVKTKETDSAEENLNIVDLKNGLYLLRLSFNGSRPITRKWAKH